MLRARIAVYLAEVMEAQGEREQALALAREALAFAEDLRVGTVELELAPLRALVARLSAAAPARQRAAGEG